MSLTPLLTSKLFHQQHHEHHCVFCMTRSSTLQPPSSHSYVEPMPSSPLHPSPRDRPLLSQRGHSFAADHNANEQTTPGFRHSQHDRSLTGNHADGVRRGGLSGAGRVGHLQDHVALGALRGQIHSRFVAGSLHRHQQKSNTHFHCPVCHV